jgi:hypothetical protein
MFPLPEARQIQLCAGGRFVADSYSSQRLRESSAQVKLVMPDVASLGAFGVNLMDRSRRPAAARAGLSQGRADAARLRSFWQGSA